MNSNVIAGSNIYHCKTEDPRFDQEFVNQIEDYEKIVDISKRKEVDYRVANLSEKQQTIMNEELRCKYAQNDPCWGYSQKHDRVVSACINKDCPLGWLLKCNKRYTEEYASEWKQKEDDSINYKNPKDLERYYKLDIISDEEMTRYNSNSNEKVLHSPIKDLEEQSNSSNEIFRIDPVSGRRMIVIGYNFVRENFGSYEGNGDHYEAIWGYADEVKQKEYRKIIKSPKIEKIETKKKKKSKTKNAKEYEQVVINKLIEEVKLTNISDAGCDIRKTLIVLNNNAEKAYVSEMLLNQLIEHGYDASNKICLNSIEEVKYQNEFEQVIISNNIIDAGCNEQNIEFWKWLSEEENIIKLNIAPRTYYQFGEEKRWCCKNAYDITHICIDEKDIMQYSGQNESCIIKLDEKETHFCICNKEEEILGYMTDDFLKMIRSMVEMDEIPGMPDYIKGIDIRIRDKKIEVLGIGRFKFFDY